MSQVLDEPDARIRAILFEGRGSSGSTHAQLLALAVGRFREWTEKYALDDPQAPIGAVDRAVQLEWDGEQAFAPWNELAGTQLETHQLTIKNAVIFGPDSAAHIKPQGSETKNLIAKYETARRRVQGDAEEIRRAVCFHEIHGADTSPVIVSIVPIATPSTTRINGAGAWRIIRSTVYAVKLAVNTTVSIAP
ncbi:MAG: hypothetical protein E6R03_04785 [Hyphomicrobiaceae bacterium]|nr:MAG: hypothetical protein E6R03_04785 [Hyphomicrobiaceae bacterium]